MNGYLIPANAKKGTLIFNIFRPFDLMLFVGGVLTTLIALAIIPSSNMIGVLLGMLPAMVCGLLVFPIPNYHNVLCALISIYRFFTERRKFVWKGWCFYERFSSEDDINKKEQKSSASNK